MTYNDRNISEGKFIMDLTECPYSDTIPRVEEKIAELNEDRQRRGLQRFGIDWDSRDLIADTFYADAFLICSSCDKDPVDMDDEEAVEKGWCDDCILIEEMYQMQNAPLQSPRLFEQYVRGEI